MHVLIAIGLVILGIILFIGLIRVIFNPYTGFMDLLEDLFIIDWIGDAIVWVIEGIADIWD